MAKNPDWTEEEKSLLSGIYENESKEKILNILSNRNWVGIQSMASKMGIKRLNYFSEEEISFIIDNYKNMKSGEIGRIIGRSSKVIEHKAREIGLIKNIKWTIEEEKFILNNLGSLSPLEISEKLNRSLSSVYHRIQELNLQNPTERYGNDKVSILNDLVAVAEEIGRTPLTKELTKFGLPSSTVFKRIFESYTRACSLAKIDVNFGITKRIICYSKNGDICLSGAEKKITDFFIENNISYTKEVLYSDIISDQDCGRMVCDWLLDDKSIVEYFGMIRHEKYLDKVKRKKSLCVRHNVKLISITDKDINNLKEIFSSYL